ncbi:MAG: GNAT family N-acetyltransferase [Lachnospiraceae bacterium]|nr:GNAT family N-acetyltransferase [Lachnospiraceae bacterium]
MQHNYTISTANIILQPLSKEDSQRLRRLRNREDNRKWFKSHTEITEEMQNTWYEKYLSSPTEIMFSIYDRSSLCFLGTVGLHNIDTEKGCAEAGRLLIDRQTSAGHGFGAEAVISASTIGFNRLNLHYIYAEIYADNIPSIKSFERAHFHMNGSTYDNAGTPMVTAQISRQTFFSFYPPSQS